MNKLELIELSHQKYESLTEEQRNRLIAYAKNKLPAILQNNESAIEFEIYRHIRSKL